MTLTAAVCLLAPPQDPVDYSNLKAGNSWTYRSGEKQEITWTVTRKETKEGRECLRVEIKTPIRTNVEWVEITDEGELLVAKDRYSFRPPYPRLKLPARAGDVWDARTVVTSQVEEDAEQTAHYEIQDMEEVSVPAGRWMCLKIDFTIKKGAGEISGSHWRAPGVGIVKIVLTPGGTFELVSYHGPAAPTPPDYFPLKDGLSWTYADQDRETVFWAKANTSRKEGDEFVFERPREGGVHSLLLRRSKEGIRIMREDGKEPEAPPWLIQWPLKPGASWDTAFLGGKWKAEVGEGEEVLVPAGKFTCVTVAYTSEDGKITTKIWLAPGVGIVKASHAGPRGTGEQVLKKK